MIKIVKAIIHKNNKYLLQLRDNKPNISSPNTWGFFGGGVDSGETHKDALIRELEEELSWKPKNIEFFYADYELNTKWFSVYCDSPTNNLNLMEGQDMKWFESKEINRLKNTPDIVHNIINKYEKLISYDDKNIIKVNS